MNQFNNMRHKHIFILIAILILTGTWCTAHAQSPLGDIFGSKKNRVTTVKPDTASSGIFSKYFKNHPLNLTIPGKKNCLYAVPMVIAPALAGIQQTFGVRDNEGNEYTRNGNDYFSLVPSVCYETPLGTLISGNVREPWRTDSEFMPHQGPFTAFLYEKPRTVALFGQTSGKNFEQLNTTNNLKQLGDAKWDLWVYDNGYVAPENRRFELDTIAGDKKGIMVWWVMRDGNSSPDSIVALCEKHKVSINDTADMMVPAELPQLPTNGIVIGGCFLTGDANVAMRCKLAGIATLNNGKWYICYPFASMQAKGATKIQIPQNLNELDNAENSDQVDPDDIFPKENHTTGPDGTSSQIDEFELLHKQQQQETATPETKAGCGCQGTACEKHNKKGLNIDCPKCKVTKPCNKHNNTPGKLKKTKEKTGK